MTSVVGGALARRTLPVMKQERVIGLAMTKWWKKKGPADAEVRFHRVVIGGTVSVCLPVVIPRCLHHGASSGRRAPLRLRTMRVGSVLSPSCVLYVVSHLLGLSLSLNLLFPLFLWIAPYFNRPA